MIDPYQIFSLPRNATQEQVSKKYKELAKLYHPDTNKNSDATQKMQVINRAYDMLKRGFKPPIHTPNYPPTAAQVIIINIDFSYSYANNNNDSTGNSWTINF